MAAPAGAGGARAVRGRPARQRGLTHARRGKRAREGDIILLHDGSNEEPAADRHKSIEGTQAILEHLGPMGYSFVTVPELVAAARA